VSFLYPRVIAIRRPPPQSGVGFQAAYAADTRAQETVIASGLRASIQLTREGQKNPVGLPGDGTRPAWDIFIPRADAADGLIRDRDYIEDDLGRRFQVVADNPDSLGYAIRAEKVEA
jgi:hypothetical protein